MVSWGLRVSAISSQPMWAMEECAMIFRVWVWLRPDQPPSNADRRPVSSIRLCGRLLYIMYSRVIGAIFCQVEIRRAAFRVVPWMTSGYHRCTGAAPSFIMIAMEIMVVAVVFEEEIVQCPVCQAFSVLANRIVVAARACTRKYLVVASVARGWCGFMMMGRMLRVLSSNPSHARSQ